MPRFLIIQTAFLGDVILSTALIEKIKKHYPESEIDFLLRAGNELVLQNNPHVSRVWVWNKKKNKLKNLVHLLRSIRREKYDYILNVQRFFSTGLLTVLGGAKHTIGFDKNPWSVFFETRVKHQFNGVHETARNQKLIEALTDASPAKPKMYVEQTDKIKDLSRTPYVCLAPASVWFTKQLPLDKWRTILDINLKKNKTIYLLGGKEDISLCDELKQDQQGVINLAGQLSVLESAALMQHADMNYVNDSGPMHLASAVNAPVTVFYCSTLPSFGFGPLSDNATVVETSLALPCRPCGIHGKKTCPEKHFQCGHSIVVYKDKK